MLHKRFVFVSLLAPSLSFASTATDSLAGSTRDVFDNLDENPAFVNVEGGKSYLRVSKAGGAQAITTAGGFGLGVQLGTLSSTLVEPLGGNFKEIKDAAADLATRGMPLALTLGGSSGDMKWGSTLRYENAKVDGAVGAVFDPSFMKMGLGLGVNMGETEASVGFNRDAWKLATSGKTKTLTGETSNPLNTGMSEQSTDTLSLLVRHKIGVNQWFISGEQANTKAKFWDKDKNTNTSRDDLNKVLDVKVGAQREDKLADSMMLFSKSWFAWSKTTKNVSTSNLETTDMALSSAHGLEVSAASWASFRTGFVASLYGSSKNTRKDYAGDNQTGASASNGTTETSVLGFNAFPTMGVGFKFGNFMVDATLAQDNTDAVGFSDKVLGQVEVTAQF